MGPTLPIMNIVAPSDDYGDKFSIIRVTEEEREETWKLVRIYLPRSFRPLK